MIKSIRFLSGRSASAEPLVVDPRPITVFVGPNNSGKSLTLREIEGWCKAATQQPRRSLADLEAELPSGEQALAELESFQIHQLPSGQLPPEGFMALRRADPHVERTPHQTIHMQSFLSNWKAGDPSYRSDYYLAYFTLRLDGRTRFSLTQPRPSGDLQSTPENHLIALFNDDNARKRIREILADAFGLYFVIDPTGMTTLRIKMSKREPSDTAEEQALDVRARLFHGAATDIIELSDGVQAFTGIVAAVLSANYKIVLIDEPEAFLAPALRRKLGNRLASLAQEREGALFAATHDADFLMGCVQAGADLKVVRLTYRAGHATARLLQPETLLRFMREPLLRSTNVLDALFHESTVVTEGDTDRAFYQEINERLLNSGREGIDNCLFLNARNKQTVPQIAGPLREIGIPAAMVVDIDVLKGGGQEWSKLLDAASVPETSRDALNTHRAAMKKAFDKTGKDMKRDGGIRVLDKDASESCSSLLDQLAHYGIFVVPSGEVESWLPELGVNSGHASDWLIPIFEKMGDNPKDPDYVKPRDDGVWKFMGSIGAWIQNENRRGMPE